MPLYLTAVKRQQQQQQHDPKSQSCIRDRLLSLQRRICWRRTTCRADVPDVMREFNIETGYRLAGAGWRYYIHSAFQLHNETLNWLTHCIGCLLMLTATAGYSLALPEEAASDDLGVLLLFGVSSSILHAASAVAHLLHSRSEFSHCLLFFVDNAAAGSCAYATSLANIAMLSTAGYYKAVASVTLPVLVFGSIFQSAAYSLALARYRRRYNAATAALMFLPTGLYLLFGCGPVIHRLLSCLLVGEHCMPIMDWLHLPVFTAAVSFYVSYFPERIGAGCFDIVGHSHQWFHLLVTCAHWLLLRTLFEGIRHDGVELFSKRCGGFTIASAARGFGVVVAFDVAFVLLYAKAFKYDAEFKSRVKDE